MENRTELATGHPGHSNSGHRVKKAHRDMGFHQQQAENAGFSRQKGGDLPYFCQLLKKPNVWDPDSWIDSSGSVCFSPTA